MTPDVSHSLAELSIAELSGDASWHNLISDFIFGSNYDSLSHPLLHLAVDLVIFSVVFLIALAVYALIKKVIFRIVTKIAKKSKNTWDDLLTESRLFTWLSMLLPAVILWKSSPLVFRQEAYMTIVSTILEVFIILMALFSVNSLLNMGEKIYCRFEVSRQVPVKSFLQVIKIILAISGLIFMISAVLGKSPVLIFSGLGAMTAILMLIFKDSILGLVAGIQLSANRMVARGDWIEMPKFGADGEVLEVALTTVKVRNWDKTITTLPTYALISDSFKNWRGMSSSGVRRIKRGISIDMNSVKFLDDELKHSLKSIRLLEDYLEQKDTDILAWNQKQELQPEDTLNARAHTNLGAFRAYINAYLKDHPKISKQETLMVRQLAPTPTGITLEIYAFTLDNAWVNYEALQSDIFDHLLAILEAFELKVFQNPTGANFEALGNRH